VRWLGTSVGCVGADCIACVTYVCVLGEFVSLRRVCALCSRESVGACEQIKATRRVGWLQAKEAER
jgi:hypothetical protein